MNLKTTLQLGAVSLAALSLAACGSSRNNDVVAEDIFAPAVETGDAAIDTAQTVFDDPFAEEAQLVTDAGGQGVDPFIQQGSGEQTVLTDASVPVVPVMTAPVYQETAPQVMQEMSYGQPQGIVQAPTFDCGIAPSSKSQLRLFRQFCTGYMPQAAYGGGSDPMFAGGGAPQIHNQAAPAQQVFMSPSFDCGMNPSSKAELAYFRANCLGAIGAPAAAPVSAPVAVEPSQGFVEEFVETVVETAPEPVAESYDCNILPTSRAELELYQQFCG